MRNAPSLTAQAVCWMRAAEAHRRNPILVDLIAERFLAQPQRALANRGIGPIGGLHNFVVGRHRFIDDHIQRLGLPQLVIVGAGYDSRPWRLGVERCFVVDHPSTLARRQRKGPPGDGVACAIDLAKDDLAAALQANGHDVHKPTAWVWEGVSMYLPQSAVRDTLRTFASRSAPGSVVFADFWHAVDGPSMAHGLQRLYPSALHILSEPIRYGLHPADAAAVLQSHGWLLEDHGTPEVLRARYQRRFDDSMHVVMAVKQ